jgi:hypothetical protein
MKKRWGKKEGNPVIHKDIEIPDRETNEYNMKLLDSVLQDHVRRQTEYDKID